VAVATGYDRYDRYDRYDGYDGYETIAKRPRIVPGYVNT
jgi:hypothetical protein